LPVIAGLTRNPPWRIAAMDAGSSPA